MSRNASRIYKGFSGPYKITSADERIIRRYVLLLSETADPMQLCEVMAYVFRTNVERVYEIIASTSDEELCRIAVIQKKWRKRQGRVFAKRKALWKKSALRIFPQNSIGYIKKEWREDECVQGTD